jgi:hypothetical protein
MTRVVPRSPDKVRAASQAMTDSRPVGPPPPPTDEELADRQERIDYLKNLRGAESGAKKGRGKKWLIILIVVLLLVAAGIGALLWKINKKPDPKPAGTDQAVTTQPVEETPPPAAEQADLKDYTSTNFALSLKYPSDWTLNDTANVLTIMSPAMKLPGADGQDASGAVVVAVRPKQSSLAEFKTGNGAAVLGSKNVKYSAPSEGQRGTTYLSYVQYASTTTKGALDAIYITGNSGYQKGQAIPEADITKVDPLVNVYFVACESKCSPTSQSTQVGGAGFAESDTEATIEAMLKSLAFN